MAAVKTTLIVGASPDLVEMAKTLGREGEHIGLISRTESRLMQFKERLVSRGITAEYFVGDVTDSASVQGAFARLSEWSPRLDRMIYNVGTVSHESAADVTSRGIHKVMSPNFFGFVNCFHLALPIFRRGGHGHAVTLSSVHALDEVQPVAYAASKAALRIYIAALRRELYRDRISITEVYLGQKREVAGWRDLVADEIIAGLLQALSERPDRLVVGETSVS